MIRSLEIQSFAIVEQLELPLYHGLNVFTGETGAGKSMIVDALSLLLGGRSSSDMVRSGADALLITAFWDHAIASRKVNAAGRSTARVEGEVVSLKELAEQLSSRITIHGQHASQELLNSKAHRKYLDSKINKTVLQQYQEAYAAYSTAKERLHALRNSSRDRARQMDILGFQLRDIQDVNPRLGEEEPLEQEITRLSHLESIRDSASNTLHLLSHDEPSADSLLSEAIKQLSGGIKFDTRLKELHQELREQLQALRAIATELGDIAENNTSEQNLSDLEHRLSQIHRLHSKYGASTTDVLAYQERIAKELHTLQHQEEDLSSLEAELARLEHAMLQAGETLSHERKTAAPQLAHSLQQVVQGLGMPEAKLSFLLSPTAPHPYGLEDITLLFSANAGEEVKDLAQVASGGELSRVMLAVSTVLGADTPTVVFDEVDAGIGGAAAIQVAQELSKLARHKQVLVVTHLAQIAAKAQHHFKVEKYTTPEGRTQSAVRLLSREERLPELARMLSGNTSPAALEHARELLS